MIIKTTVLLVEDDPMLADLVISDLKLLFPHGQLSFLGPADCYTSAIEMLQKGKPDIVLLDIELHEDSQAGIRIAQYINQVQPIPVIFLSGLPRQAGFDIAKFTSPVAFLQKPYQRQQLADHLDLVMIRQGQKRMAESQSPRGNFSSNDVPIPNPSIFVNTGYGELTALTVKELILLEADGKIIRAFLKDRESPLVFTSPGLKNFFSENHALFGPGFFQLSRKYVVNIGMVRQIKDNHVILPRFSNRAHNSDFFYIPFPANSESKKELLALLRKGPN